MQRDLNWLVDEEFSIGKTSSAVIICRNRADINYLKSFFRNKKCNAIEIDKNTPGYANSRAVYLTTFHTSKGLEFDYVFIPFLMDDKLPDSEILKNAMNKK